MSYILDALTKSQQQRRQMDVPRLDTPHVPEPGTRPGRARLWNGALLLLAGAGIAYGLHAHFNAAHGPPVPTAEPLAVEPPAARSPVSRSDTGSPAVKDDRVERVASRTSPGQGSPVSGADGVMRQPRATPPDRAANATDAGARPLAPVAKTAPARPAARVLADSPARPEPRGTALARESTAPAGNALEEPTASPERVDSTPSRPRVSPATLQLARELSGLARQVPPEPSPSPPPATTTATAGASSPAPPQARVTAAAAADSQPPALRELPWDVRADLGELEVNAHLYSDVPAERLVVINMRRYREGEQMASGPRVDAITPRGAVLSHASRRFRIDVR